VAQQRLGMEDRKRNRENGVTDIHHVVETNSNPGRKRKKSNALKKT